MKIIKISEKLGHPQFAKSFAAGIIYSGIFGTISNEFGEHYSNTLSLISYLNKDFSKNYSHGWDDPKVKITQHTISKLTENTDSLTDMKKEWALAITLSIRSITKDKDIKFSRRLYFILIENLLTCIQNYQKFCSHDTQSTVIRELDKNVFEWYKIARLEGAAEGIEVCLIEALCGSTELAKNFESSNNNYDSKYPAQQLRELINRNPTAYQKAVSSLSAYIFYQIYNIQQNSLNSNIANFINSQIEKIFLFNKNHEHNIPDSIAELIDLAKDINNPEACKSQSKDNLNDLENFLSLALLSVVAKNVSPYNDPFALNFACKVLIHIIKYLNKFNEYRESTIDEIKKLSKSVEYFKGSTREERNITLFCSRADNIDPEVIKFFISYPLRKSIDLITLTILYRLPIFDTKEHLEEFIREELVAAKEGDLSISAVSLLNIYNSIIEKIPDREYSHQIDGPNGPIQALNKFTLPIKESFSSFSAYIRSCVLLNTIDFYNEIRNESIITSEHISSKFNEIKQDLEIARKKFKFINNIIIGNNYIDFFEKLADESIKERLEQTNNTLRENIKNYLKSKSTLQEKINALNSSLKTKDEFWESQFQTKIKEISDLSDLAYKEIEKLTNEKFDLIKDLDKANAKLNYLSSQTNLFTNSSYNDASEHKSIKHLVKNVIENKGFRLSEYLKLAEIFSNGNLVILPEAYKNIEESDKHFKQKDRFIQLIFKLAFEYRKIYFEEGDVVARKIFSSSEYAAQESETTTLSSEKRIQSVRTVNYNGNDVLMRQHLKIGVSNDVSQCLRIYFFADTENKKIVIGYCGPHPLNSKSA